MSAADNDRALVVFTDSLDPAELARLRVLVNARTATQPPPPTGGPETYRGIPVPGVLRPNWEQHEAAWWRLGVNAALDVAAPLLLALADTGPCEFDALGACMAHDYSPPLCADGEARKLITEGGPSDE